MQVLSASLWKHIGLDFGHSGTAKEVRPRFPLFSRKNVANRGDVGGTQHNLRHIKLVP
jgi:hypothetical protein